jgi:hypothetical protein
MKKLVGLAVVALLVVGVVKVVHGRSPEAKANRVCEKIVDLCGDFADQKLTKADIDECTADMAKGPKEIGEKPYDEFVSCTLDADNCGEVIGCAAGAAVNGFGEQLKGFGHGFGKMIKK